MTTDTTYLDALEPKLTKYIPHVPFPKQAAFLNLEVDEALYGGAAGPGKSDALLMAALQYVDVPGYAAILFRRTYSDLSLPGALMDRAQDWLRGTDAHWTDKTKTWHFPSGASLTFGYMESETDRYRYQGAEFQFVGFDELTQFTKVQYSYMHSRTRRPLRACPSCGMPVRDPHVLQCPLCHAEVSPSPLADVPIRVRSASNPGGVGHSWVARTFDVRHKGLGKPFVRARLEDNPYVDKEAYIASLSKLDPLTRKQLLDGDWTARQAGGFFLREYFETRSVERLPANLTYVRFWDLAATEPKDGADPDYLAGCKMARDPQTGLIYFVPDVRFRGTPAQVESLMRRTAERDGRDVEIFIEQEPGASGKAYVDNLRRHTLAGYTVTTLVAAQRGSKTTLAGPFSSQAEAGNVHILQGPWEEDFYEEAEAFPDGEHDDQIDAASSAFYVLTDSAWKQRAAKRRISVGTIEYLESRTPTCTNCNQPVLLPANEDSWPCPRCSTSVSKVVNVPV